MVACNWQAVSFLTSGAADESIDREIDGILSRSSRSDAEIEKQARIEGLKEWLVDSGIDQDWRNELFDLLASPSPDELNEKRKLVLSAKITEIDEVRAAIGGRSFNFRNREKLELEYRLYSMLGIEADYWRQYIDRLSRDKKHPLSGSAPLFPKPTQAIEARRHKQERQSQRPSLAPSVLERAKDYVSRFEPVSEGGRNAKAFSNAGHLRAIVGEFGERLSEAKILSLMREWNSTNLPPLPDHELAQCVQSSSRNGRPREDKLPEVRDTFIVERDGWLSESAVENLNLPAKQIDIHRPQLPEPCEGFIADVVGYSLATAHRRQPELSLFGAIALQSVLCGRKVRTDSGTRPSIGLVVLAPTGSGKQHPREVNARIMSLAKVDDLLLGSGFTSDIAIYRAIQDTGAGLCQVDEIGRFLNGSKVGGSNEFKIVSALMMLLTSDGDAAFKPLRYASDVNSITMRNPCLSLFGTATREQFFSSQNDASLLDGFLGRLIVWNAGEIPQMEMIEDTPVPQEVIERAAWWGSHKRTDLHGLKQGEALPQERVIASNDDAKSLMLKLSREFDNKLRSEDRFSILWSRAFEKVRKLSLIAGMSRDPMATSISRQDVEWSAEFVRASLMAMEQDLGEWMGSTQFEGDANEVFRAIKSRREVTATQLNSLLRKWPSKYRESLLDALVEQGRIERLTQTPTEGGRPKKSYRSIR